MNWRNNPVAELIIDLAGRMTENSPALREIWIPALVQFLSEQYPEESINENVIQAALQAGDDLSNGDPVLHTSQQRRSFRQLFPSDDPP